MTDQLSPGAALAALRKPKRIICRGCGQEAERRGRGVYCSDACRNKAWQAQRRASKPA